MHPGIVSGDLSAESDLFDLRARVERLLRHHDASVMAFSILDDDGSVRGFSHTLDPPATKRVSLASSATCIRSLTVAPARYHRRLEYDGFAAELRDRMAAKTLHTGGLKHKNPFTLGLVASVLSVAGVRAPDPIRTEIVGDLESFAQSPGVGIAPYPPNGYLSYGVLAGLRSLREEPDANLPVVGWSRGEFHRHLALLSAGDSEEGDPNHLAYNLAIQLGFNAERLRWAEVNHALHLISETQLPRGTWEKKEPLFSRVTGGDAYCFTFELLSALLKELDSYRRHADPDLDIGPLAPALERAMRWVERNVHDVGAQVKVWRSGHRTEELFQKPESWATAEVYAFLHHFHRYLDGKVNDLLLSRYGGDRASVPSSDAFDHFFQPEVRERDQQERANAPLLGDVLRDNVLKPLLVPDGGRYSLWENPDSKRRKRSAIFFGPPGTGKSSYVKAMAEYLGWPIIVLDASHFAANGMHLLSSTIGHIFRDLRQATDVVIFLDEMEELIRKRKGESNGESESTFEQRLLTTTLLPKLQDLHDRSRSIFVVATNHFDDIDTAARRFGRFDIKLEVLPSCLSETCRQLVEGLCGHSTFKDADKGEVERAVEAATKGKRNTSSLEWANYAEIQLLLDEVVNNASDVSEIETALMSAVNEFLPQIDSARWLAANHNEV